MLPKIAVLPGSAHASSLDAKLAAVVAIELAVQGADVTRLSLQDYPLPVIDPGGGTGSSGPAENAVTLGRMIAAHDGLFVCAAERNASVPPLLKNAIDWLADVSIGSEGTSPLRGRIVALGAVSGARSGGAHCSDHLRTVLASVGAEVITRQCLVPDAARAFDAEGRLVDASVRADLGTACRSLLRHCSAFCQ